MAKGTDEKLSNLAAIQPPPPPLTVPPPLLREAAIVPDTLFPDLRKVSLRLINPSNRRNCLKEAISAINTVLAKKLTYETDDASCNVWLPSGLSNAEKDYLYSSLYFRGCTNLLDILSHTEESYLFQFRVPNPKANLPVPLDLCPVDLTDAAVVAFCNEALKRVLPIFYKASTTKNQEYCQLSFPLFLNPTQIGTLKHALEHYPGVTNFTCYSLNGVFAVSFSYTTKWRH